MPTAISIVNNRADTVWVAAQHECSQRPFAITDPDGRPVHVDGQVLDCDSVRAGNCPDFGGCQGAGVYRVGPGQQLVAAWDGRTMASRQLPADQVGKGCPAECIEMVPVPAGTYTLSAGAWSTCVGDQCTCEALGQPCDLSQVLTGQPDLTASATVVQPDGGAVKIVFQ